MAKTISLKIYTPEKLAFDKNVYRAVLPDGRLNLTVIEDRAPTSLILEAGVLQILDESDNVVERFFIDTGVVDIAKNECTISTLHLIKTDKITAQKALELVQEEPQAKKFYQIIGEYFENYPQ